MNNDLDVQLTNIITELEGLSERIRLLPDHPAFTDALNAVIEAKEATISGRSELQ